MNIVKALLGIGLILMSLVGFVFADENITVNETVVNDTLLYNITTTNETLENSTINETDDNETATAVIISENTDTEKCLDYVSENLENYKFWVLMALITFAGYLVYTKLL